jgi:hypothetical protein
MPHEKKVNVKKLVETNDIKSGDFLIVETSDGTRILDYKNFTVDAANTTFAGTISSLATAVGRPVDGTDIQPSSNYTLIQQVTGSNDVVNAHITNIANTSGDWNTAWIDNNLTEIYTLSGVGIGTTDPQAKIHVYNTTNTVIGGMLLQHDTFAADTQVGIGFKLGSGITHHVKGAIAFKSDDDIGVQDNGIGNLIFCVDSNDDGGTVFEGDEKMRITHAGYVGIGTIAPECLLEVTSPTTNADICINGYTNYDARLYFRENGNSVFKIYTDNSETSNPLKIYDYATATDMVTFVAGNVGIGDTSPDNKLHVTNASGVTTEVVKLEQLDVDEPFILFTGTENSGVGNSLSSSTSVGSINGYIRISVNGTDRWIATYASS